ncbi:uncharacterized protein rbm33b isoform X1 [Misgurnus anguillicaudatus]|uniref:uncharacterized protein rbm33b isoform X1 n=2 Tax=Misgurnus anguillicaudatus TaxID=75329 RepID=UPI003CCF0FAA
MNSDSEMVDDWLTAKQDTLDTSDEELNDDLLRSDEENETMRCHNESISQPKRQAIAKPFLVCGTSHLVKEHATCAEEEQTKIKVDPGEVLDIEINAPSGDEFQDVGECSDHHQTNIVKDCDLKVLCTSSIQESSKSETEFREDHMHSCTGLPAPEETLARHCCSPEPRFPGQHMFDQQHPASVLDTNPPFTGPTPKGFLQPPACESDPWRPSTTLQGPTDLHPAHDPLQNHQLAQSVLPFTAPSGPRAQKPAVLVRAVVRMGSSAKPVAVARGMPIAARQPASAKSTISAKTPSAPGMMGRHVGQKVEEEPQTPSAPQNLPAKQLNIKNNEVFGVEDELYRQKLKNQIQLRKKIIREKEQRRRLRAINGNQHQRKHPFGPPASNVQQTNPKSCFQKITYQSPSRNPSLCSDLNFHPEYQPLPPLKHQYHASVVTPQPPWQQAPAARRWVPELRYNRPHQQSTNRAVLPDHRKLCRSSAWQSQAQDVWEGGMRMLEMTDCDTPVPDKIGVVRHRNLGGRQESTSSNLTPQMSRESSSVIETKSRVVTFTTPNSSLQGPRLRCHKRRRLSTLNQSQHKVPVGKNQSRAFIPFSSGLRTESVDAQSNVNFISVSQPRELAWDLNMTWLCKIRPNKH